MPTNLPSTAGIIPYDVPTPGGDVGVWDTGQNDDTFTQISKDIYGLRENSYLQILGGGRIAWDSATNQVSWSEDIIIRDHVTDKTHTLPTSESPITLSAQNTIAFIDKVREAGSNQTYNAGGAGAPQTVAAGSLTKAKGDNDHIVLFVRTSDDTLWIPWVQREILNGDHWQFGAALSWYERSASARKPGFKTDSSASDQVIVVATATAPAVVLIDGKLYANTSNATMDLDTSGRNGLDTGTKALEQDMYLYAIPPTSGRTFDVVSSVTPPTTGPTGFSSWSYIGAFATETTSAAVMAFQSVNGRCLQERSMGGTGNHTGTTTVTAFVMNNLPLTVKAVILIARGETNASGHDLLIGGSSGVTDSFAALRLRADQSSADFVKGEVPIFTAQTIYLKLSNSGHAGNAALLGWIEDPMEYQ